MATTSCLEAGQRSARILTRLDDGCPPDSAYRDFSVGLLAVVPCLFGLPPASGRLEVAPDGREWTVVVEWSSRQRRGRRALRGQMEADRSEKAELADRLQTLQRTVADLVSPDGIEEVLARVAGRSAFVVHAQQTVLAVRLDAGADPLVYGDGLSDARAQEVGRALLDGSVPQTSSALVVKVASARRTYGWFLACNPSGHEFLEGERYLLEAYASLSAAALDSATALEEARLQGTTARELLGLARTLANLTDAGSIASTLARALTTLSGAERGTVFLWDLQTQSMRLEANAGMPPEVDRRTRGVRITHRDTPELAAFLAEPGLRIYDRASITDPFLADMLEAFGSAGAAVVPLMGGGDVLGAVVASWTEPRRQAPAPDFQERLEGLADHGTTALRTARLVERMRQQALYDGLTGLPNRALLTDRVALALECSARLGTRAAVVFCDLDDFKTVNDSLGHAAGDQLLVTVARRISEALRPADVPARLGGDEFAVLLDDVSEEMLEQIAARLLADVTKPILVNGRSVRVGASIGTALETPEIATVAGLLAAADAAMYAAKRSGKNRSAAFIPGMHERALRRLGLADDLAEAAAP